MDTCRVWTQQRMCWKKKLPERKFRKERKPSLAVNCLPKRQLIVYQKGKTRELKQGGKFD